MKIQLGNGTIKIGYNSYPINWTGQYAQHVAENYINGKENHILLHVEIQQALSKCKQDEIFRENGNTYFGLKEVSDGTIFVSFIKSSNFVSITTGYKMSTTPNKIKKGRGIGTAKQVLPIAYEQVTTELADGFYGDDEQAIKERLIRFWTFIYKKRGYKNFELEFV